MPDASGFAQIEVYLTVNRGLEAIAFYQQAFGAAVAFQELSADGRRLMHATLNIFGGQISLSDHFPEEISDVEPVETTGRTGITVHINLPRPADVDSVIARAAAAGATITMPAWDTFWVMRYGRVKDPFGHIWSFGAPSAILG